MRFILMVTLVFTPEAASPAAARRALGPRCQRWKGTSRHPTEPAAAAVVVVPLLHPRVLMAAAVDGGGVDAEPEAGGAAHGGDAESGAPARPAGATTMVGCRERRRSAAGGRTRADVIGEAAAAS